MKDKDLNNSSSDSGNGNGNGNGNDTSFKTRWKVEAGEEIIFQAMGGFTINWGDGTVEKINGKQDGFYELSHSYPTGGIYTVDISNSITGFSTQNARFVTRNTPEKLVQFKQWGTAQWKIMEQMFMDAQNMVCTASDAPDLSKVKTMKNMFRKCRKFNSAIQHWDFSTVENMVSMLADALAFDQDLRKLQVKPGTNTDQLFDSNGYSESLADYNKRHAEKYAALDEKQEIEDVLKK